MRVKLDNLPPDLRAIAEEQMRLEDGKPAPTKATRRPDGFDSKYEMIRDGELRAMKAAGEIKDYKYHPMTLILSTGRRYSPDFMVWYPTMVYASEQIVFEEVKGFWREKDRLRWEFAAQEFPMFTFRALTRPGGSWSVEEYVIRCPA